jgi:hypothetical protein
MVRTSGRLLMGIGVILRSVPEGGA